jgi:hypothetical protein
MFSRFVVEEREYFDQIPFKVVYCVLSREEYQFRFFDDQAVSGLDNG